MIMRNGKYLFFIMLSEDKTNGLKNPVQRAIMKYLMVRAKRHFFASPEDKAATLSGSGPDFTASLNFVENDVVLLNKH